MVSKRSYSTVTINYKIIVVRKVSMVLLRSDDNKRRGLIIIIIGPKEKYCTDW
jgi:hypothetical protein